MDQHSLANMEAAFNIFANAFEMVGVRYGLCFLLLSIIYAFTKSWKKSRKCFLIGLGVLVIGILAPGLTNWIVISLRDSHQWTIMAIAAVVSGILGALAIGLGFGLLFLPIFIAKKRQAKHFKWIVALCILSLAVFVPWPFALYLAEKETSTTGKTESSANPRAS